MVNAFHHIGVGVRDAGRSHAFYRDFLGFRETLSDRTDYLDELQPVIGASVEARIIMAADDAGGPVLELVEHISTKPLEPDEPVQWGDIGYLELGLGAFRLEELYLDFKSRGVDFVTPVRTIDVEAGVRERYAYLRDPDGTLIQLVEVVGGKRPAVAGIRHVAVGVADLDGARGFYGTLLGLRDVIHEFEGRLPELDDVTGGKEMGIVVLGRNLEADGEAPRKSLMLKLVHTPGYQGRPIFKERRWGDIGLMEMAFRVDEIGDMLNALIANGIELFHQPARISGAETEAPFVYLKSPEDAIIKLIEGQMISPTTHDTIKRVLGRLKRP